MTNSARYRLVILGLVLTLAACGGAASGSSVPRTEANANSERAQPLSLRPLPRTPYPTPTPRPTDTPHDTKNG